VTGVVLIATTITLVGSVDATLSTGVTQEQRQELDDLTAMFGMMSAVSLFLAIFVVGSTFGFVVATRRRELGLLRLIGATDARSAASCWVNPPLSPWQLS
jgi:putative ABC transport system permease protein